MSRIFQDTSYDGPDYKKLLSPKKVFLEPRGCIIHNGAQTFMMSNTSWFDAKCYKVAKPHNLFLSLSGN